jgi:hypothetical protein
MGTAVTATDFYAMIPVDVGGNDDATDSDRHCGIASLVSPVCAQISGQGGTTPANPQTPAPTPAPLPSSVGSSAATPGFTQYQSPTQSQLNKIGSNPNQSHEGMRNPEGPLR